MSWILHLAFRQELAFTVLLPAHKTLETYPSEIICFSFGPENTKEELDLALHALSVVSGITKGGISHGI